ncbi:2Fe-2S iron-sulfur cluster-binding protein [Streptomyces canus]
MGNDGQMDSRVGTLLELADAQGGTLPARCRARVCGTCAATVHGPTA